MVPVLQQCCAGKCEVTSDTQTRRLPNACLTPSARIGTVIAQEIDVTIALSSVNRTAFTTTVQMDFQSLLLTSLGPVVTQVITGFILIPIYQIASDSAVLLRAYATS